MTEDNQKKLSKRDLFADSTMTFGEHLEELRVCLFKAVFGLVIGTIIGLAIGGYVVDLIQSPLKAALEAHYKKQAEKWADNLAKETEREQPALPWTSEQIKTMVEEQGILPQQYFIDPNQFAIPVHAEGQPTVPLVVNPPTDSTTSETEEPGAADTNAENNEEGEPDAEKPESKAATAVPTKLVSVIMWHKTEDDPRMRVKSLNAHEAFVIWIKASVLVGLIIASPWIFYQVWQFVASGLYPHERRYVHMFLPISVLLFLIGAVGAFMLVFEPVLQFLFSFNEWMGIDPDPRISEWLSFVLVLPLGFGISFQLPLVMLFLERIRVFSVEKYLASWRVAILVIAVLSMFLTPADPYSMLLMAVPLTFLYFLGILFCKYMPKVRRSHEVYEDDEDFD